jgi:predicted PolB exonuclease-like 3'-5' exonuclease
MTMKRTVVDIETVGQPLSAVDERFHDKLLGWFDPGPAGTEMDDERRREAERRFSLWGPTGQVIVIGMHNPDSEKSKVLASDDEAGLLREFWGLVKAFDLTITFNGKQFDYPYLKMRSAIRGVVPSLALDCRRFTRHPHYDLREVLSNFGAWRHGSLDFYCSIFGIASPKQALSGDKVGEAYAQGRLQEIADYCQADVEATGALYMRVKEAMA